jgi:hypothetical protein
MKSSTRRPTEETYKHIQLAYDFFNEKLFQGNLPQCLITMQRQPGSAGYFCNDRFSLRRGKKTTDEIALNPEHFSNSEQDVLSTLVHEMAHLWQQHFGKPGRGRYHNRQWAAKMEELGLCPSDTGRRGGSKTGDHMSHYIKRDGAFQRAWRELRKEGFRLRWTDFPEARIPLGTNTRQKFSCPRCALNAWAKPAAHLVCGDCGVILTAVS